MNCYLEQTAKHSPFHALSVVKATSDLEAWFLNSTGHRAGRIGVIAEIPIPEKKHEMSDDKFNQYYYDYY